MTENCFRSISPDGITGMIFALEGMRDTVVLLNGPMGCRFYHSSTSGFLMQRPLLYLPSAEGGERVPVDYNYLNDWFFRQDRVPCTWLDGHDYVYGTGEQVRKALRYLHENISFSLLAIVNSPGAALIGDDLYRIAKNEVSDRPVVYLESPGYSVSFEEGFRDALLEVLAVLLPEGTGPGVKKEPKPNKTISLLGISIWHRYCEGDIRELTRLFSLCGIETGAVLLADCPVSAVTSVPDADLNVVLYPESALSAAVSLKERFGTPYYCPSMLPIGFAATETLLSDVCSLLGLSASAALEQSARARGLAWSKINGIFQMYGKPKGVPFHVCAPASLEKAYSAFLRDYLGMEEVSADEAELLFSDANRISERALTGKPFTGIEIAYPGMGYTDLTVKTHMGIEGALFLIEQVLNGILSK